MTKGAALKLKGIRGILSAFIFLSTCFVLVPRAHAGVCDEDPPPFRFDIMIACRLKEINPLVSIQRTISDAAGTLLTNFLSTVAFSSNPDDVGTCGVYIMQQQMQALPTPANLWDVMPMYTQADVEAAVNAAAVLGNCDFNSTLFGSRASGSLMGVTKFASNTIITEPPPVSFAYYLKYNAQKLPVVGQTAYAQSASYNALGLELILEIWEDSRNIAYAMMSVIMIFIGILIITRKRINPQTVVTAQTALPRVVISLILITFSYPIGAIMASLVLPLIVLVLKLYYGEVVSNFANMNILISAITVIISLLGPMGLFSVVSGLLIGVVALIAMIVAYVKIIFIYLKIIVQIVLAPIQFAAAAVPGQEHLIGDWFKQMIAKVLAIPAMFFMIAFAWYILVQTYTTDYFYSVISSPNVLVVGLSFLRAVASSIMTLLIVPLMVIMVLFMSIKADKAVESFIMGSPPSGGKRK